MGIAAVKLPYGEMATLSKLQMRTLTRQEWKAFSQQQRAYNSGLKQVSRWGEGGLTTGGWVMPGGQTCSNYIRSFKWGFISPTNQFAPFRSG